MNAINYVTYPCDMITPAHNMATWRVSPVWTKLTLYK